MRMTVRFGFRCSVGNCPIGSEEILVSVEIFTPMHVVNMCYDPYEFGLAAFF